MCVLSMVTDHYTEKWGKLTIPPVVVPMPAPSTPTWTVINPTISAAEIAEFRTLLDRARKYDIEHNEPHCELAEKKAALTAIAKALGVEIDFL